MRARIADIQELGRILDVYERATRQVNNKDKSSIMFSPNTNQQVKIQVRTILPIEGEARSEKYLGLPIAVGKSWKSVFGYIKKKIRCRIQG